MTCLLYFLIKKNNKLDSSDTINNESISNAFNITNLIVIDNPDDLFSYLFSMEYNKSCLLLMSSGNFGSMDIDKLKSHISNGN